MINVTYNKDGIRVDFGEISKFNNNLPLRLKIKKHVSGETQWETNVHDFWFATYPNTEMFDVEISDSFGHILYRKNWDVIEHGNYFYKALFLYNKKLISNGIFPKGLVIGTHDGEFGEWVPIALRREAKMFLVEASEKQFNKLNLNYNNNSSIKTFRQLITPNGGEVKFYEGGQGYTNSVDETVIKNWEKEEINCTVRDSMSINDFIEKNCDGKLDWIHLDVEGLDANLILSLHPKFLTNFIIFEDYNLVPEQKEILTDYLKSNGYLLHSHEGICLASK